MAKQISLKEMTTIISENITLVSDKTREAFDKLPVEEKYKKIKKLIANKAFYDRKKSDVPSTAKKGFFFSSKLKDLFDKKGASTEDVDAVIEFCTEYKESLKTRELERLTAEIERLNKMKEELMK